MKKILFFIMLLLITSFAFAEVKDYVYILKVDSTSVYPSTIYPNSEVSLNITLSNISSLSDAKNIKVKINPNPKYFSLIKESDYLEIIKFEQTGTLTVRFKVNENTPGGYYSIPLKITYEKNKEKFDIDTQTTIQIENYDKINLVITKYPKDKIYLDNKITIEGYVINEGNTTLKGIMVNSTYTENLIPTKENSFFIGNLLPKEKKQFIFSYIIPKTADTGIYELTLNAKDISSNEDSEKILFNVEDVPSLIISSIDKSIENNLTYLTQGTHFTLSVQLENISKSKAKSVIIKIKDSNNLEGTTLAYVGSIDPDDSGAGIFDIHIKDNATVGEDILNLEITYLDEYDQKHTMQKQISLYIEKKKSNNTFIYVLTLIIILAIIGYIIYSKRKKKKIREI